jgi:proliferating cell nuclear antigen
MSRTKTHTPTTNTTTTQNPNLALELKTVQSSPIKISVEALKEILTDANLDCDEEGIKIIAMDGNHTVLVHMKLHGSKFEHYYCPNKLILGVNMINLFKLIKTMHNNDTLTLYVDKRDQNKLGIKMENEEKNTSTTYKLDLMDLDEEVLEIPPAEFETIITMPSSDFQKICRDMDNLAETVEIKSVGSKIIFACKGDFAEQETVMGETNVQGMQFKQKPDDKIVQGVFALKHLVLFTKCTNLCTKIEMYLKNDYPIIIEYVVANLGFIRLCLAPQVKKKK